MELESILYKDGTMSNISAETASTLMRYNETKKRYVMDLDNKSFVYCNNMWMEF